MFSFLSRFKVIKDLFLNKLDQLIQLAEKNDTYQNSSLENEASLLKAQIFLVEQIHHQGILSNQAQIKLKALELQQKQILGKLDILQRQEQHMQVLINKLQPHLEILSHNHHLPEEISHPDDLQRATVEQINLDFQTEIAQLKSQITLLQELSKDSNSREEL